MYDNIVSNTRYGHNQIERSGFMSKTKHIQSLGEEIANSVSHGVGALLSMAGTVVAIVMACMYSTPIGIVSASLYGASLIILYLFSTLYHSLTHVGAKKVFRIFDHCSIFILILGSYIPMCLVLIGGAIGWTLFGINAFCTVLGIVFNSINLERWNKPSLVLYLVMGWSVIIGIRSVIAAVDMTGMILLVGGGLAYTLGIIFFRARHKYMHFIWHIFVLAGSVFHYFFMLFYCFMR